MLTADSLAQAMQNSSGVNYAALLPAVNQCLLECGCTTVDRAAMWFGQIGEESGGLRWMEEIASGSAYEGRADLGNTQPGDGVRFKGRGPIQVTGRHNYTVLSQWAFGKGLVPSPTYFVDNPAQLASNQYGFVGVTWYWTTQQPRLNQFADEHNIEDASKAINRPAWIGDPTRHANGIQDRTQRWQHALSMGDAILPTTTGVQPVTDPNRPDFNEINEIGLDNGNHASVRSRPPMNFFLHTQQPPDSGLGTAYDSAATDLSAYLRSTSGTSAVSYHYTIRQATDGGVTLVDVVDTDLYSWAVLNANVFSINLCFAGSKAEWTRDQWMTQSKAIDVAAFIAVEDAKKYGFSTEVILPPYGAARAGFSDHRYVTECLHYGNHTDVGGPEAPPWTGFPWDLFVASVNKYTNNAPVVTQPVPATPVPVSAWPKSASDRDLLEYCATQLGPGDPAWASKGSTMRDKLWSLAKGAAS